MAYRRGDRIIRFTPSFLPFTLVYAAVMAAVRVVDWILYGIRIEGRENLRGLPRAVLVSNHTLLLDPALVSHAIRPRRTYFTMLEDTALIPYLGTFVRLLGGVPIPGGAAALRTLEGAASTALAELGLIHFFPEGECYRGCQDIRPFHPGAFLLACRAGLPVVPVTTVLHSRGLPAGFPPRVTMVIGSPVPPPPAGSSEHDLRRAAILMGRHVRALMQEAIDARGGSRALYRGVMPRLVKHPEPRTPCVASTGPLPSAHAGGPARDFATPEAPVRGSLRVDPGIVRLKPPA